MDFFDMVKKLHVSGQRDSVVTKPEFKFIIISENISFKENNHISI